MRNVQGGWIVLRVTRNDQECALCGGDVPVFLNSKGQIVKGFVSLLVTPDGVEDMAWVCRSCMIDGGVPERPVFSVN